MKEPKMFKRMSVVICTAAFAVMTAGYATAQTATEKTKAAADKSGEVVTDAAITSAVKSKLLGDPDVSGLKIDVDTTNGVVTLSGVIHRGTERAEALRLARETKGVKSVKNNLKLEPVKKSDTTATTGRTDKDDKLKVEVKDDTTPKLEKAGDKTADAAITSAVKTKFLADTKVSGMKIDVDTTGGVVTLTGTVASAAEKAEAIRLAKTTSGVKSVVDKLTIK